VTSQGSAYARFRRALTSRNPTLAWAAAAELGRVDLADALALCLLVAGDPHKFDRAAARWHARYCAELPGVTLAESQLVLAAVKALPHGIGARAAVEALAQLADERGLDGVVAVLDRSTPRG
jgi:HEAT repeat protein